MRLRNAPALLIIFLVALPLCMGIVIASGSPRSESVLMGLSGAALIALLASSPWRWFASRATSGIQDEP